MPRIQVIIPNDLHAAIKVAASREDRSVSNYVSVLLRQEMEHLGVIKPLPPLGRVMGTVADQSSKPLASRTVLREVDDSLEDVLRSLED